jgi:hypothetical protein
MAEARFPGYTNARRAVLDSLRSFQGKTLDAFWLEDEPRHHLGRHHSERLRLRFSDGSEVNIQIGTNLNTLGHEDKGYHLPSADQLSAWFYVTA